MYTYTVDDSHWNADLLFNFAVKADYYLPVCQAFRDRGWILRKKWAEDINFCKLVNITSWNIPQLCIDVNVTFIYSFIVDKHISGRYIAWRNFNAFALYYRDSTFFNYYFR